MYFWGKKMKGSELWGFSHSKTEVVSGRLKSGV